MKKLLVFQHIEREKPSYITEWARERGFALDVLKLWKLPKFPKLGSYDALIILGGSMSVYEEYHGKRDELVALKEYIGVMPILGICLGAQLLAHALGAPVYPHKSNNRHAKEIGYYEVSLTPEGKESSLFKSLPSTFTTFQWHGDTFDLPSGATLLATSPRCMNQAFSRGKAYGIQFHIETTPEVIRDLIEENSVWTHTDFDLDEKQVIADADSLAPLMKAQCFQILDNFLAL